VRYILPEEPAEGEMGIDDLKQKTVAFIQELRNIRDEAIRGNLEKYRTWKLISERLNDYESDLAAKPYQFPDGKPEEFFRYVKWHYWNILYSLFGDELTKLDPFFERSKVPILLPGIECLFNPEQLPDLPIVPDKAGNVDTQVPERKVDEELPPVIKAVLNDGLLNETPVNGKYPKKGDKKDGQIIEWIFNYSGYEDSLTTELYMQYIQTQCKSTTIQDYITRKKKSPD
jgi:hypothetical protein